MNRTLREIAAAVAGRFDHYVVRRDDGLRGRDDLAGDLDVQVLDHAPSVSDDTAAGTGIPSRHESVRVLDFGR